MDDVVIASTNKGKVAELQAALDILGIKGLPLSEFNCPEIEETGSTFTENALIKARAASLHTGMPTIADDSGLCIDYLDGAPGIYSARYAGASRDFQANMDLILEQLHGVPQASRQAHYHCVLVYLEAHDDKSPVLAEATWPGYILDAPVPGGGFGYDPVFFVPDQDCAVSKMSFELKNRISHRAQALSILMENMKDRMG